MSFKTSVFIVVVIWNGFCVGNRILHLDVQESSTMVEKGRKHLESLQEKTRLPQYGQCWMKALNLLQDGCRVLSDEVHVDIALRFTGCFMDMSGQEETLDCPFERTESLKKLCMSQMSDRAFAVFTEFFTQTQNMCFFLQNQNWHIETERTINRLSSFSRAAGEQLQLVNGMQDTLLQEQHKQFDLQLELMRIGRNLSSSLNDSQLTIDKLTKDLKRATEQHSLVLEELFREFHQLHRWIVGRYAFVDGLIFYFCHIFLLLLLTSLKRTADARGLLLALFLASLCLEWCLHKQQAIKGTILLDDYRWIIRQTSLICSVIALVYYVYRFDDFPSHILREIREQNRKILEHIVRGELYPCVQSDSTKVAKTDVGKRLKDRTLQTKMDLPSEQNLADDACVKFTVLNDRRSISRLSFAEDMRETIRSEESVESRSSRYNLRSI